ncbi:HAD family hydrolase [Spongiibacter sp. KMU-158]|uniref:HAD family hydrolase n=1 Tax=Spongiibacter pelagi TaxID=2760804 RepID=A0A927C1K7_9GAMM|nr:HAD family hydrolase [Spongiibacter pelagi]MBD2857815.1 HAD family hydrolase [Spongiibacter pelagi]
MPSPIKLITVDLDDTLWPAQAVLLRADRIFYAELEKHAPKLTSKLGQHEIRAQRLEYLKAHPELEHYISDWRKQSLLALLAEHGYATEAEQIAEQVFHTFWQARQRVTLFPYVSQVLTELSQKYLIISITNGNAHLDKMPLSQYVRHSLRAEQFGLSKPSPRLFEEALKLANCNSEDVLHIGDHPLDDIEGARQLGIRTIQAQLLENNRDIHPDADAIMTDWRDAPELIARL